MLQPKCRQPYVHNEGKMELENINEVHTPNLPPRPPLPNTSQLATTIEKDLAKQQQLSDWYYIKTGPKSPLPTPRAGKKNDECNITNQPSINRNSNNSNESIFEGAHVTKDSFSMCSQNVIKPSASDVSRIGDNVQIMRADGKKFDKGSSNRDYQAIKVPLACEEIQEGYIPPGHQYSVGEPLCKFNYKNNSNKVNGCLKRSQPQGVQLSIPMLLPPSPSMSSKKVHQQQSHPFYYVEPSQNSISSPKESKRILQNVDSQQKFREPHCKQIQNASNLKSPNEHLCAATAADATASTTSNLNSNLYKLTGIKSQQTDNNSNANSNSFEHVNVTSGFSSLSGALEMTIENKYRFNSQNYVNEQRCPTSTNFGAICQQSVSSSPSLPVTHQFSVSKNFSFYFERKLQLFVVCLMQSPM